MAKQGQTIKQANRAIRQETLREQLSAQGHVQHVIDICNELNCLANPLEALEVTRKKIVIDTKLKLINKYLPDLRSTEITGESGGAIMITEITRTII